MQLISHRGNIYGPNPSRENTWSYIQEALDKDYDCEIDVWWKHDRFWLGHDAPTEEISGYFLRENANKLWIHCKDKEVVSHIWLLEVYYKKVEMNFFWHQNDDYTLTSMKFLWTYPGKPLPSFGGIAVKPELFPEWDISEAYGICSDYVDNYRNNDIIRKNA